MMAQQEGKNDSIADENNFILVEVLVRALLLLIALVVVIGVSYDEYCMYN